MFEGFDKSRTIKYNVVIGKTVMEVKEEKKENKSMLKGVLCIMLAALGFSLMTFFVRISGDVPTMQKAFFRNAVAAVIATVPILKSKDKFRIKKGCFPDIACRCIFGTSGLICNFFAIDRLGIADANMLNKLSPFFAIG